MGIPKSTASSPASYLESIGSSQSSASTAASYSSTPKPVAKSTASSPASYLESIGSSQSSASTAASSSSTPSYLDAISSPGQVKARLSSSSISTRNDMAKSTTMSG